jgi:hypothetical protein
VFQLLKDREATLAELKKRDATIADLNAKLRAIYGAI